MGSANHERVLFASLSNKIRSNTEVLRERRHETLAIAVQHVFSHSLGEHSTSARSITISKQQCERDFYAIKVSQEGKKLFLFLLPLGDVCGYVFVFSLVLFLSKSKTGYETSFRFLPRMFFSFFSSFHLGAGSLNYAVSISSSGLLPSPPNRNKSSFGLLMRLRDEEEA